MLYEMIQNAMFQAYADAAENWLSILQDAIGDVATAAFFFEESALSGSRIITAARVTSAFNTVYYICVILLAVKLLYKGWCVYVLWRDGDPEVSPTNMVTGAVWAIVLSAAFPILYRMGINGALSVVNTVLELFAAAPIEGSALTGDPTADASILAAGEIAAAAETGTFFLISAIVFLIVYIVLLFVMLGRGIELMIWRICFPIATVGLVNSDGGQWNNYLQMLLKQVFTTMYQYFCFVMSIRVLAATGLNLITSIAFIIAAIAAPKMFAQFMTPRGGGGLSQKAYTTAMLVRTLRAFTTKV